jgi:PAS domain S-box-containing protein
MPEAVMVARPPHGVIVTSNAAAQRLFGLPADDTRLMGRRAGQLWVSSDPPDAVPVMPIMQAIQEGVTVTGVELTVRMPNGQTIPVVASAAPLLTEDGDVDAVVGVFQDVGPLKEAERLRDEFISVVSHELRSPLTPIRGFAQLIARDLEREGAHDQHVAWLHTLQRHTDRLTRLVDDLLDVSRLRAGRLQVRRERVDLVELCRGIVESKRTTVDSHQVVLETDVAALPADVDGDRIQQVVDNLVGNAIKYTDGGRVTVRLEELTPGGNVRIQVSDQGRGIPQRERESLFAAFYRARSANESAVPGLGLGLFICRELVQAHDGTITVDDAPGGGARFTIDLPRHMPAERLTA